MKNVRKTAGAVLTAALVSIYGLGVAHAAQEQWEVRLYVDRSQLQTAEGLEEVHAQMLRAARTLCRDGSQRTIQQRNQARQCRDDVMMQIALGINSEPLLALAQSRLAGTQKHGDAS